MNTFSAAALERTYQVWAIHCLKFFTHGLLLDLSLNDKVLHKLLQGSSVLFVPDALDDALDHRPYDGNTTFRTLLLKDWRLLVVASVHVQASTSYNTTANKIIIIVNTIPNIRRTDMSHSEESGKSFADKWKQLWLAQCDFVFPMTGSSHLLVCISNI